MARIFISHSSRDDAFARQLCGDLELTGHAPWIDDIEIVPGESIMSSVQDGISEARHAIVVVSNSAISSGWVDAEWKAKYWGVLINQKVRVIPVLREACELPLFLRILRRADFTQSYAVGFAELCLTLRPIRSQVPNVIDRDFLHAIEHSARTHTEDHIRIPCAHAIWSCRPDRAKPILEDALHDQRDVVRLHAQLLLELF
jgi:hypothetical protein